MKPATVVFPVGVLLALWFSTLAAWTPSALAPDASPPSGTIDMRDDAGWWTPPGVSYFGIQPLRVDPPPANYAFLVGDTVVWEARLVDGGVRMWIHGCVPLGGDAGFWCAP